MVYLPIVFLCNTALFLALLEDRYQIWAAVSAGAGTFLLSLVGWAILPVFIPNPATVNWVGCLINLALLSAAAFFLYKNNILQLLNLALLCFANYLFLHYFMELVLGLMPFSTAGIFAALFSTICYLLFSLMTGLILYRVTHYFALRHISGFLIGLTLLQLVGILLHGGKLDFLFRIYILPARLLCSLLLYGLLVFLCRSIYHVGVHREKLAQEAARDRMLEMEAEDYGDITAMLGEVYAVQKQGEYALDTIDQMVRTGDTANIAEYVDTAKRQLEDNPILRNYEANPFVNAVLASKAAQCQKEGIGFECNCNTAGTPLKTPELCILVNEALTKAIAQCRATDDPHKKIRFTVFPASEALNLEAVFTGNSQKPPAPKFSIQGRSITDILASLLSEAPPEDDTTGLESTEEIVARYSGSVAVSGTEEETILQVLVRF